MSNQKRNILIIAGRYLPGYKDGGPVRSIKNLVDFLGEEYNFMILTCDRDHGDTEPYPNIKVNDWNKVGKAEVYYVPPKGFKLRLIKKLNTNADVVYVCGVFNDYAINTLILKRLGVIKKPVAIAAMGLFSPMEFRLKYKKKKLFTTIFNISGMFKNIYWSATSEMEVKEIKNQVKTYNNLIIAQDLPRKVSEEPIIKEKPNDTLKIVFISRITPKKNLEGTIKILSQVKNEIEFTIYGSIHDHDYWNLCQEELIKLPSNIKWKYEGNIASEEVVNTLKTQHVFLFPTLGENYGHVVQEALSAGCPCIISDQTPWQDLEDNGAGYVIPLKDTQGFVKAIEAYSHFDEVAFNQISLKTLKYAIQSSNYNVEKSGYKKIFKLED